MTFSVTQNGKPLFPDKYTWDPETKTFSTNEVNLVLDFSGIDGVTFNTGWNCTFSTGENCTFNTDGNCTFTTDGNCTFKTGGDCTFNTGGGCIFSTGGGCIFSTGGYCTFNTGWNCIFTTDGNCTFKTDGNCTFTTGGYCTFKTFSPTIIRSKKECTLILDNKVHPLDQILIIYPSPSSLKEMWAFYSRTIK